MHKTLLLIIVVSLLLFSACSSEETEEMRAFTIIPLPSDLPDGQTVLEVSGLTTDKKPIKLDLETIMEFPVTAFSCDDPWVKETHKFTGVALYPLLYRIGLENTVTRIEVYAENDYMAVIGLNDIEKYRYILAYKIDDRLLYNNPDFKKRGTLMIAINFDVNKDLDVDLYKNHLVWQVKKIIVR